MKHTLYVYTVTVRRDSVPGWNHQPEDFAAWLQSYLDDALSHYRPHVKFTIEVEE